MNDKYSNELNDLDSTFDAIKCIFKKVISINEIDTIKVKNQLQGKGQFQDEKNSINTESKMDEIIKENKKLKEELEYKDNQIKEVLSNNREKITHLTDESKEKSIQLEKLLKEKKEHTNIKEQLNEKNAKIIELNNIISGLKEKEQTAADEEKINILNEQINSLKADVEKLSKEVEFHKNRSDKNFSQIKELRKQIDILNSSKKTLENENSNLKKRLEEENTIEQNSLKEELENLKQEVIELKNTEKTLVEENLELKNKIIVKENDEQDTDSYIYKETLDFLVDTGALSRWMVDDAMKKSQNQ